MLYINITLLTTIFSWLSGLLFFAFPSLILKYIFSVNRRFEFASLRACLIFWKGEARINRWQVVCVKGGKGFSDVFYSLQSVGYFIAHFSLRDDHSIAGWTGKLCDWGPRQKNARYLTHRTNHSGDSSTGQPSFRKQHSWYHSLPGRWKVSLLQTKYNG